MAIASANCFAQQYPFVHYSPKDGLVSNRVRSIYQDGKGLMYFLTMNGLSVYDGTRFTNYTSEEGLENDIVNCVMEMGNDSIWVVTNTGQINCLVKGKAENTFTNHFFRTPSSITSAGVQMVSYMLPQMTGYSCTSKKVLQNFLLPTCRVRI
jgi:ligand-binding sensor domain-containing protein